MEQQTGGNGLLWPRGARGEVDPLATVDLIESGVMRRFDGAALTPLPALGIGFTPSGP
ncbi:hypothetical protein [Rhodococcus erythropolis]